MNLIDAAFAAMFACGIVAKIFGARSATQLYLIIANAAIAWWFWEGAMPLTAFSLAASAVVAAIYAYREIQST